MRVLSKKEQEKMIGNGWKLKIKGFQESELEFIQKLYGYKKLKFYRVTTSVRGYYDRIAMVKR